MWCFLVFTILCLGQASAQWATHYAFHEGLIYLKLKNEDLVALNFSLSGLKDLSESSLSLVNLQQNQRIQTLATPPLNSSMFVHGSDLYAFTGAVDESLAAYDQCGDGIFQLLKYERSSDSWVHASNNMTFTDVDDVLYYQGSTYLTSPTSSEVYVYGGVCSSSGKITTRILSLDMNTMLFSNISTSTKPQGFYGGSTVWAPGPQQLFVIGGRSPQGWINMYQLATWNFESGWLFQTVKQSGTSTVSSRTHALALPIFKALSDSKSSTFNSKYNAQSVLVLGGTSADSSNAGWARLTYADNDWSWQTVDPHLNQEDILGAAIIYDTLVVINGSSANLASSQDKRLERTYTLNLYDVNNDFAPVKDLKGSLMPKEATESNGQGPISRNTKVIIGTLVPVSALGLIFGIAVFFWRRKVTKKDTASVLDPLDYQLGHYRTRLDPPYSLLGSRPLDLYQQGNDSGSTLEVASINSWVRKRQEYEAKQNRPYARHSYLASNETLSSCPQSVNDETERDMADQVSRNNSATLTNPEPRTPMVDHHSAMLMIQSSPTEFATPMGSAKKAARPIRLEQLRGFLYTQTPPHLPLMHRKSRLDPGFIQLGEGMDLAALGESDNESLDQNIDVQVLVSSKRKSVLRVTNPDVDVSTQEGLRLRNPSK